MASSDREVLKEGFLVKKVGQMAAVYAGNCMHNIIMRHGVLLVRIRIRATLTELFTLNVCFLK